MCGIAGRYAPDASRFENQRIVRDMLTVIRHRGPDDQGIHVDDDVAIGTRRLSIIDIVGGHQPIANEDGSVVVAFNGEIYNYRDLTEALRARGHTFSSASDTEV